jgi:hypothetical protein
MECLASRKTEEQKPRIHRQQENRNKEYGQQEKRSK